jgi:gamma-glutamylcyclotransferase
VSWLWYFAYGSNMQTATFRGRRGIEPRRALAARASGWKLVLDKPPLLSTGHSFANVVREDGATVYGVAYEICQADMAHVDLSEGVGFGNYERVPMEIEALASTTMLPACTLTSDKRIDGLSPSDRYMGLLIDGAVEHGLPGEWIATLRAIPAVPESEEAKAVRALLDDLIKKRKKPR